MTGARFRMAPVFIGYRAADMVRDGACREPGMTSATLSSEEFDQDPERAKTLTAQGPVVVTEAGLPAYVLLGIEDSSGLPRNAG